MIVLDTHVLMWAARGEGELGPKTRALIDREWARGRVAVCAPSFWELAMHDAGGRIALSPPPAEWRAQRLDEGLLELPIDGAIAIRAVGLGDLLSDPADRLIVATALQHRAALVTADEALLAWNHTLVRHDARA